MYRNFLESGGHNAINKWSHYPEIYDEVFLPRRETCGAVLEIGVQNGGSLQVLAEMFPHANVFGIDINPACASLNGQLGERVKVIIGDATSATILATLPTLDVIVDDGSHIPQMQAASFAFLFQHKLSLNGVYIVEDLEHSYYDWWRKEPRFALGSFYDYIFDRAHDMNSAYINAERAAKNYYSIHLRKIELYRGVAVFYKSRPIVAPANTWWDGNRVV